MVVRPPTVEPLCAARRSHEANPAALQILQRGNGGSLEGHVGIRRVSDQRAIWPLQLALHDLRGDENVRRGYKPSRQATTAAAPALETARGVPLPS